MNLKDQIQKLASLQEIDKEIHYLMLEKENEIPAKTKNLEETISQKQEGFNSLKNRVNRLELDKKNKEGELSAKEEGLKKATAQLYTLKSNKEYQTKLKEISSIKADISCAEEEVINVLDVIDHEKKRVEDGKKIIENEVQELKEKIRVLDNKSKEIKAKIAGLENKRNYHKKDIDPKILNQYQSLLEKRNGLAIAAAKNRNCSACHINLTHQKINEIKMYDRLAFCESCMRILYIPEDLEL